MNEDTGTPTLTEEEEVEVEEAEETTEEETTEEEVDWKSEAQKAKELADNYKKRAEKAEKKAKEAPSKKEPITGELSQNDLIFLAKSDIHEDDISDVTEWAKFKGISVKDAYAQMKPTLAIRQEERTTAQVTSTKSGRGKKPVTGDDLLEKANTTGEIPTDDQGMRELILAKQKSRGRK